MTQPLRIGDRLDRPEAKRALNERLFTTIAREYRWMTGVLSFGRDAAWKRRLVTVLPDVPQPTCVDIACGTGDLTRLLAQRYPGGSVLGLDLTEAMLVQAERLTSNVGVTYRHADMMSTGLPDSSVDIVTGGYALRNAPDLDATIAEMARILRVDGCAGFLDFTMPVGRTRRCMQLSLLRAWGGLWGLALHANWAVYGYIAESLRRYPTPRQLNRRFAAHGLRVMRTCRCFVGVTSIVIVRRHPLP